MWVEINIAERRTPQKTYVKRFGVSVDFLGGFANGSERREVEHNGADVSRWNFLANGVCGELKSLHVVSGDDHEPSVFCNRASSVEADPVLRCSSDQNCKEFSTASTNITRSTRRSCRQSRWRAPRPLRPTWWKSQRWGETFRFDFGETMRVSVHWPRLPCTCTRRGPPGSASSS